MSIDDIALDEAMSDIKTGLEGSDSPEEALAYLIENLGVNTDMATQLVDEHFGDY
jgi:hypothetical protein